MAQPVNHLCGVELVVRRWAVVGEVEKMQQPLSVSTVFEHRNALSVDRVVQVHDVHPVAAVVDVRFGEAGHSEEVLVAEGNGRKRHAARPNHVDLGHSWVREKIQDSIPRPREEQPQANKEGQEPKQALDFRFVWRECVFQPMDFCSKNKRGCNILSAVG